MSHDRAGARAPGALPAPARVDGVSAQLSVETIEASGRAGLPSPCPPEAAASSQARARKPGSTSPALQSLRERAEATARREHPEAGRIFVNPAHTEGPVIEVYDPKGAMIACYRYVGWEL